MEESKVALSSRLPDNLATWGEFRELVAKYQCLSLSEGAPYANPPHFLREELVKAIAEGHNQLTRSQGDPILVEALAKLYSSRLQRPISPYTEVIVGAGGVCLLYCFTLALTQPGDEVVLFEPFFPVFVDHIKLAGCQVKGAPLLFEASSQSWQIDWALFRKAFSEKTALFIFNTPMNPTGKVFSREEMETMTKILHEEFPRVKIISDEVYEFYTYEGAEHHHIATIGENWKKTISIFDGGKLMSCTGWNIGYGVGPEEIVTRGQVLLNTVCGSTNPGNQVAFGRSISRLHEKGYVPEGIPDSYVEEVFAKRKQDGENLDSFSFLDYMIAEFDCVREYLIRELKSTGLPIEPLTCYGGYFVLADVSKMRDFLPAKFLASHEYEQEDGNKINKIQLQMPDGSVPLDLAVCRWLALEKKVVAMPTSLFYLPGSPHMNDSTIRITICRGLNHTKEAVKRLKS